MVTMTSDREVTLGAVARRVDHEVEHQISPEPTEVISRHPRLVLERRRTYVVTLDFWLHLVLPEGAAARAMPVFVLDGTRRLGSWVEADTADHTPGYGQVRDRQTWVIRAGFDAILTAGLTIEGAGRYSVGHLSARAWDPTLADHVIAGRGLGTDTIRR